MSVMIVGISLVASARVFWPGIGLGVCGEFHGSLLVGSGLLLCASSVAVGLSPPSMGWFLAFNRFYLTLVGLRLLHLGHVQLDWGGNFGVLLSNSGKSFLVCCCFLDCCVACARDVGCCL